MDALLMALVLANLYIIVYYRLMVGHCRARVTGRRETSLLAALSYASRKGLPPEGIKYYRRYWYAVAALAALLAFATAVKLPGIRAAFS